MIVGPGSLWVQEAKRQVSHVVGIDGFAGPSDLTVIASSGADLEALTLDLAAQAEHGDGSLTVSVSEDESLLLEATAQIVAADMDAALAFAEALAPEHLQLAGSAAEALAPRVRPPAVCSSATRPDGVRGLRRGLEPHAPHRGCRALCLRAQCPPLPPPHGRGAIERRGTRAGPRRRCRSRRPRGSQVHAASMAPASESPAVTRTATITRKTGETDVALTLGLDGTGAGPAPPASASSTTCSTCWPATGGWTSRCA